MRTDSWIERVILQVLSRPDKRYKYNYEGKDGSTEELIADCAHLKDISSEGPTTPLLEMRHVHEEVEEDVEDAAHRLEQQGLLTKVGERPIRKELFGEVIGTTSVWEPTEEGLAEVQRINEAYSQALADLVEDYDEPEDVPPEDLLPILKTYGVIPDGLSSDFYSPAEDG